MSGGIANNTDFRVLDETEDYLVVDKPAPLKIHPSVPDGVPTLWDGLRDLLAYEIANGGQVSIINRLDRETSGVVLVAKHARAARRFGLAMQRRQMMKTYRALVFGWPEWQEITVDQPIRRQGEIAESAIWVKQCVHPDGAACTTGFKVMASWQHERWGKVSDVEARPLTGRMHQIRVHLAYLGFPVVGDKIYGADETCYLDFIDQGWTAAMEQRLLSPRHLLHSSQLSVAEPERDEALQWQAPLPW